MMYAIEYKINGEYWKEDDYCTDIMIAVEGYKKCVAFYRNYKNVEVRLIMIIAGSTKG